MTSLLTDTQLREYGTKILQPFEDSQVRRGVVSYGLSSVGYDIRLAEEFRVFTNTFCTVVDPKSFDPKSFVEVKTPSIVEPFNFCLIPPNSFALGRSLETFTMPNDVIGLCVGKSTYARCGIIVNVTPLEPGWKGHLTIEISNTTPLPARVYAGEGIAQVLFFRTGIKPSRTYADRQGKYQGQEGVTLPRI